MINFDTLILSLCSLFFFGDCGTLPTSQKAEQTLVTSLFTGYNKDIRPNGTVTVQITAVLQQIVTIDDKQQIMTSSSFIFQGWIDDRLSWTPNASNDDIEVLMLPVKRLWIPDTMILNSADSSGYLTISDYSLASVSYEGFVGMMLPALTVKTKCNMRVQKFPFDRQVCPINLTSWSQGSNRIAYVENDSYVIDMSDYTENPLWELLKTDVYVVRASDRTIFEETDNAVISIQLHLQRKPLFFMINGIFACLILNGVTLLAYALSFAPQISLCMMCFMTYSVYSLNFSNLFPQQSQYIMMITLFFLLSIGWTAVSMVWFIIHNHYITKAEMPKLLYQFCGLLQNGIFCCCFTSSKRNANRDDKKRNVIGEHNEWKPRESNKIKSIEMTVWESAGQTDERMKSKGDPSQAVLDIGKIKERDKKEIEARCNVLNRLVFIVVLVLMFTSNISLWLIMAE